MLLTPFSFAQGGWWFLSLVLCPYKAMSESISKYGIQAFYFPPQVAGR